MKPRFEQGAVDRRDRRHRHSPVSAIPPTNRGRGHFQEPGGRSVKHNSGVGAHRERRDPSTRRDGPVGPEAKRLRPEANRPQCGSASMARSRSRAAARLPDRVHGRARGARHPAAASGNPTPAAGRASRSRPCRSNGRRSCRSSKIAAIALKRRRRQALPASPRERSYPPRRDRASRRRSAASKAVESQSSCRNSTPWRPDRQDQPRNPRDRTSRTRTDAANSALRLRTIRCFACERPTFGDGTALITPCLRAGTIIDLQTELLAWLSAVARGQSSSVSFRVMLFTNHRVRQINRYAESKYTAGCASADRWNGPPMSYIGDSSSRDAARSWKTS